MSVVIKLTILLLAAISQTSSKWINPCLYNREDVLPCIALPGSGVRSPTANQYAIHATRFRRGPRGLPLCIVRKEGELVADIEDLGSAGDVKFLFSPGAERSPNINYTNQMLVEYNVQCKAGKRAFVQFDSFDLEPKNCFDGCSMKCQDYIEIDTGLGGVKEYCGQDFQNQVFTVGTGHFTLKLRTSFFSNYPGFRIFVTCFKERSAADLSTCTKSHENTGSTDLIDLSLEDDKTSKKLSLTNSDRKTLSSLTRSLYTVALRQTRRKIGSWPPASYSLNEPGDILDISELNLQDLTEIRPPEIDIQDPRLRPIIENPIITPVEEFRQRKKRSLIGSTIEEGPIHLDRKSTLEAVRNENSCNPILHSITSSYINVAQRMEPSQLDVVRREYQQEQLLRDHLESSLLNLQEPSLRNIESY